MPEERRGWATRLCSVAPGADPHDLRRWAPALDGVRVVGLGEATHGTGDFSLEHRIIEFLVRERGTRVVAFEASEAASTAVDRWTSTGEGDAREALRRARHRRPEHTGPGPGLSGPISRPRRR